MTLLWFLRASQRRASLAILASLAASSSAACVKMLPPAPTPEALVPQIPAAAAPPPEGSARLVVDVVEGPTRVLRIRMTPEPAASGQGPPSFRFVETPELLCPVTPCVADLPPGNILLGFSVLGRPSATEADLVHVGPEPSVYRRSLSVYDRRSGSLNVLGIIGTSLGGASIATGAALLPIGLAKDSSGLTLAGGISLGAGAALLSLGIWAIRHDPSTFRPGSSIHYPLPR